ncbi:unnamed protein product, partial [marine sediment metagenome]
DEQLLETAGNELAKTISATDTLAETYAEQFYREIIVPFCRRHKLSFWSGNGDWWFSPPRGRQLDLDAATLKWAVATGNAKLVEGPRCPFWEVTASTEEMPTFLRELWKIEELLNIILLGSPLGYWVPSFSAKALTPPSR